MEHHVYKLELRDEPVLQPVQEPVEEPVPPVFLCEQEAARPQLERVVQSVDGEVSGVALVAQVVRPPGLLDDALGPRQGREHERAAPALLVVDQVKRKVEEFELPCQQFPAAVCLRHKVVAEKRPHQRRHVSCVDAVPVYRE